MDLTQEFINQEVRRIVFSLKKATGEYVHIFSILEKIDEDMQDYYDFTPNYGNEYNDFIREEDGNKDKLFLTVDRFTITKDQFENPWDSYYSGKTLLHPCTEDYRWPAGANQWRILPSDENVKTELSALLPRRSCPCYVRYCVPKDAPEIINRILSEEKLRKQLEKPRVFDPRWQAALTPTGKN